MSDNRKRIETIGAILLLEGRLVALNRRDILAHVEVEFSPTYCWAQI